MTLTRKNNDKKITGLAVILFSIALWWGSQSLIVKPSIALSDSEIPLETAPIVAEIAPVDDFGSKEGIMAVIQDKYPEVDKFCFCESTYRPTVCSYAGCHSGMGLCGFIPSTWNETLRRMEEAEAYLPERCKVPITGVAGFQEDKSHPVFDAECNLLACVWLHAQDGDGHWNSSKDCWAKRSD